MEFLLIIATLLGLFWAGVVFLRGGLIGGTLLMLLAGSCFGHAFFNLPTGVVPLTSDRLLLIVLVAQYVVYRRWGWTDPKPFTKTDYILAAFLAVLVVSVITHDFTIRKALPLSQLLFFYLMPAVTYWIARQSELTERTALWLFGALGVFGLYLSVTAFAEMQQAWSLVFPKYIASPAIREFFGRGRGPFLNPAGMGFFQGVGLVAAFMWWPRVGRVGQLLLLFIVLPLFVLGAYSTLTRSVWMGLSLGMTIVIGLSLPRQWRVTVLGTLAVVGVVTVAATWQHLTMFKRDKEVSVQDMAESAQLRPILATVAWHMFLDRPLLGCGFGQYEGESLPYLSDRSTDLPLEKARPYIQHNAFLGVLTETGIVGLVLFVSLLACWAQAAWRLWRTETAPLWARQCALLLLAALGVYLPNSMFHNVAVIPMFNMLLFFLAGISQGVAPLGASQRALARLRLWVPVAAKA